uniref:Uncharacterized protein n=1 Tax=Anguilla anguilla TaxID=7936 RepID=A0A0E9RUU6_ANGAN
MRRLSQLLWWLRGRGTFALRWGTSSWPTCTRSALTLCPITHP